MSLYRELAAQTAASIASGVLRAGDRLPSVRAACRSRHLSPITVLQAYQLLERQGLIEARPRSGYFVRGQLGRLPEPELTPPLQGASELRVADFIFQILESVKDPQIVPLGSSFPDPHLFPLERLGRCLGQAARRLDPRATVTDLPPGNDELRRLLALQYLQRGAPVAPEEIIVTAGAMEAINLCLQAVTRPGDVIAIESPAFYAGLQASERLGLRVVEVPTHPRLGVDPAALAEVLRIYPVKACLFMLSLSNPTGASLPDAARRELLALLARHDIPLIEDDVYGELHFSEPPLCTKALDPEGRVMHVSSFAKCLAPGYRIGWVAAGRYREAIRRLKLATSLATAIPVQIGIADYLKQGGYEAHLRRLREQLKRGEAMLSAAVAEHFPAGTRLSRAQGGYFAWVELPAGCDALQLHQQALRQGISVAPGPIFSAQRAFAHCLRLNFGHPDDPRCPQALRTLGELARAQGR